jgi:hypothetical protein
MVEVPLNSFRYHFRRLTWQEEFKIPFSASEDQRKTILAHTLSDVSGLKISTADDARKNPGPSPTSLVLENLGGISRKSARRPVFHHEGALPRIGRPTRSGPSPKMRPPNERRMTLYGNGRVDSGRGRLRSLRPGKVRLSRRPSETENWSR